MQLDRTEAKVDVLPNPSFVITMPPIPKEPLPDNLTDRQINSVLPQPVEMPSTLLSSRHPITPLQLMAVPVPVPGLNSNCLPYAEGQVNAAEIPSAPAPGPADLPVEACEPRVVPSALPGEEEETSRGLSKKPPRLAPLQAGRLRHGSNLGPRCHNPDKDSKQATQAACMTLTPSSVQDHIADDHRADNPYAFSHTMQKRSKHAGNPIAFHNVLAKQINSQRQTTQPNAADTVAKHAICCSPDLKTSYVVEPDTSQHNRVSASLDFNTLLPIDAAPGKPKK
jgi:hypothetical protein